MNQKEKIYSLQTLRALAFLGIFFVHSDFFIGWSAFGVSIFFVLSGYLLTDRNMDKKLERTIRGNLKYSLSKIRKLYPLHIITMVSVIPISFIEIYMYKNNIESYLLLGVEIILNIFLIQTWIPYRAVNVSLNGVAWYLSAMLFLYFMFPYIATWIKKKKSWYLIISCILIFGVQIFSCIPFIYGRWNSQIYEWYMYCFPVFRLGDFFMGCCLGKIYKYNRERKMCFFKYSIIEIIATAITIFVFLWCKENSSENIIKLAFCNWTTMYIPLAIIWIYIFREKRGIITEVLCNDFLIFLGNISEYIFLIHYVITQYTKAVLIFFEIELNGCWKLGLVTLELIVSIIISIIYIKIERDVNKIFKKIINYFMNIRKN